MGSTMCVYCITSKGEILGKGKMRIGLEAPVPAVVAPEAEAVAAAAVTAAVAAAAIAVKAVAIAATAAPPASHLATNLTRPISVEAVVTVQGWISHRRVCDTTTNDERRTTTTTSTTTTTTTTTTTNDDDDDDASSGFQANKKITLPHETRRRIKRR
ncbi:hypothetical protein V1478_005923 [Vespula squamosa]|uniref:Uncharacterized protein n=1 Tax=Vespula squamosa TaxID=30214 RepID=A0ABD2BAS8_VESSQ